MERDDDYWLTMPEVAAGRMCQQCCEGNHHLCGMQTWCQCECDGEGLDGFYLELDAALREEAGRTRPTTEEVNDGGD